MNLHVVLTEQAQPELGSRIAREFPDDFYEIAPNQWVIHVEMTDRALCEKLDASEGKFGRIMVSTFVSYYGWHGKDFWNWLSLKENQ